MSEPRKCQAPTRTGEPCKAPPLTGTDLCMAHSPANVREAAGFIADNGKAGRKPKPRPDEVARRLVEDNVVAVLRPHFRTLGFDVEIGEDGPRLVEAEGGPAKVYGTSPRDGSINVSNHDDLGAMMTASEKLQDRIYGRPKQTSELTGSGGGPVEVVEVSRDRGSEVARLLAGTHAVRVEDV